MGKINFVVKKIVEFVLWNVGYAVVMLGYIKLYEYILSREWIVCRSACTWFVKIWLGVVVLFFMWLDVIFIKEKIKEFKRINCIK